MTTAIGNNVATTTTVTGNSNTVYARTFTAQASVPINQAVIACEAGKTVKICLWSAAGALIAEAEIAGTSNDGDNPVAFPSFTPVLGTDYILGVFCQAYTGLYVSSTGQSWDYDPTSYAAGTPDPFASEGGTNLGEIRLFLESTGGGDTTPPILSSPTAAKNGETGFTGSVSTDEGNGTLYYLVSTNTSEPVATVKAGSSQAVSATGVQNVSGSGLNPGTQYYLHFVHTDAAGNDSAVSTGAAFTTDSADSVDSINGDSPVLDGATAVAFTYSGFQAGDPTSAKLTDSFGGSYNLAGFSASGGSGSVNWQDIAALLGGADAAGVALTGSGNTVTFELTNGTETATVTVVYNPKAGHAISVASAPVDTSAGSYYEGFTGTVAANDQTYYPAASTTSIAPDGPITSDLADGSTLNGVTYDQTDNTWKTHSVVFNPAAPDTTPPVITRQGSASVNVNEGDAYNDAGATATDDTDGDITANIVTVNPVNTAVPGVYTVTYDVDDAAGNSATQVTRSVTVIAAPDTTPPVITLQGSASVNVNEGDAYNDAGATATDDTDGNITANIVTVNPVNTAVPGVYTVTYDVDDAAGNSATQVTRSVTVIAAPDTTPPVITLQGSASVNVNEGDAYNDAGATATDDTDGNITANIVTVNPVNTAVLGVYTVTYDVDDAAGNSATQVTRSVTVIAAPDTTPPVITRQGSATVNVNEGDAYNDAGATASDDTDGDITANIVTVNPVNTAVPGVYTITYDVDDAAGNSATQVTRMVTVISAPPGPGHAFEKPGKESCYKQINNTWSKVEDC